MSDRAPTMMARTDLLHNGDVRVTTPCEGVPAMIWSRDPTVSVRESHDAAAARFFRELAHVTVRSVLKGTGPGHGLFKYHFAKVQRHEG